jgi:hypothetical protein
MGRFLKNEQIKTASYAIQIPIGGTVTRPDSPVDGQFRFNTDTTRFEIYYGGWKQVAINGTVNIVKDTFTGDGITTGYVLSQTPISTKTILVFVGNVQQNPDDAYSLSGANINFSNPPPSGQTIIVYHNFASTDAN